MEDEDIHLSRGLMESEAEVKKQEKLDFFAGCALSGLIAGAVSVAGAGSGSGELVSVDVDWAYVCEKSYSVAHLMMQQRAAENE